MTTANDIIRDAMVDIGAIGTTETPDADDAALALRHLNRMIDSWAAGPGRLYAYHVQWHPVALNNRQSITIGPGGDLNIPRPVRIEEGGFSRMGDIDEPLEVVGRDKFSEISLKTLGATWPQFVYYEASQPLGRAHFWPQGAVTVHLPIATRLEKFADLTTDYYLPPAYEEALVSNLAQRLCRPFTRPVPATLPMEAAQARARIKLANFEAPELTVCHTVLTGRATFLAG